WKQSPFQRILGRSDGRMYGLLIESAIDYLKRTYGEETWQEIRIRANIQQVTFVTHERYSENMIPAMALAAAEVTGEEKNVIMDGFGIAFVSFVGQYGYDRILKVLGRHLRDFLNGLDNLHEYLRFSYPKLSPPSFFCENETRNGLTLHYRSKRKGYLHYVKGQIRQVAKIFYKTKIDVDVVREVCTDTMSHVVFQLYFDNTAFKETSKVPDCYTQILPMNTDVFFELFPFHIVFNSMMVIRRIGNGMSAVLPGVTGQNVTDVFCLIRPLVKFSCESILAHTNNVFELLSINPVKRQFTRCSHKKIENEADEQIKLQIIEVDGKNLRQSGSHRQLFYTQAHDESAVEANLATNGTRTSTLDAFVGTCLHLKGQMMYMPDWSAIVFLGTPIMESLDTMFNTGLYINDLSMHDSSRDLVLAGTQQSAELKLALDQEQQKSKILEESMQKLDAEMKRTDSLLYQMIPKPVADRLRRGEPAITTCEVFHNVTILFSDVVGFTTICSQISPMEVVSMLNAMYTKFDQLSEEHKVYKVETIGDAYMVVSGAPEVTKYHALHTCDMALNMLESMSDLRDPSTEGNMKIRVGIHSGTAVAGVVGIKMPRYCLFGDTVNTASRMETNGEAMKIHISETTKVDLECHPYIVQERGTISVKGKGIMKTYWLLGKRKDDLVCPFSGMRIQELERKLESHEQNVKKEKFDMRSLYSPVSFEDIVKSKSTSTTPITTPVKKKNSDCLMNNNEQWPSNVGLCVDADLEKHNHIKHSDFSTSPSKQKDVNNMIKNAIHTCDRKYNSSCESHVQRQKSQTCFLL
ncbi:hypothetical protein ScPMuIL_015492, partial [Solemya velum]